MWWEIKDHIEVRNSKLYITDSSTMELAKNFGTPLYVYSTKRILEVYRKFYDTIKKHTKLEVRVHYAMKANSNKGILKLLQKEDAWIDAVSPEEARVAIDSGFPSKDIVYRSECK